jgi:hypothetical protein
MRALLQNLPLKVASLGLAVLLWLVIAGERTSEMGLQIPVELQNFPRDLELTGDPVDTVEVRLRASPGVMKQLGPAEISAQIDLQGVSDGERIVHLTAESIRVPFGVTVVRITPAILNLNFERTLQKLVPVRPRILGRPAPGHEVAEIVSEPAEVRIAGPKSRVMEVESAFTEALVDRAETTVDEVNIGLRPSSHPGSPRVRSRPAREAQQKGPSSRRGAAPPPSAPGGPCGRKPPARAPRWPISALRRGDRKARSGRAMISPGTRRIEEQIPRGRAPARQKEG